MVIHCLWLVGKAKNKGHGNKLLQNAVEDAKRLGMHGIVGMSAEKGGWLPNKKIFLNNGFEKVDEIAPNFSLYAKAFNKNAPKPRFYPMIEKNQKECSQGAVIIFTDQCPYITDLVEELKTANTKDKVKAIKINNCKEAQQNGVYPYGTYCIICDGEISLYKHSSKKEIYSVLNK
ncbi:MAG: hypothetical protein ACFFFB_02655 [Candidatus Heimdallarchaeota archaeon]